MTRHACILRPATAMSYGVSKVTTYKYISHLLSNDKKDLSPGPFRLVLYSHPDTYGSAYIYSVTQHCKNSTYALVSGATEATN